MLNRLSRQGRRNSGTTDRKDRRLQIYLDDHLAILVAEAQLAARCRRSNRRTPLGDFLHRLEVELRAQQAVIRDVIRRVDGTESSVKQSAAWVAEKLGRLKLNDSLLQYSPLSRLLELEALGAAAQERVSLWDNLDAMAQNDTRLHGITYSFFCEQSREHLQKLECRRRYAAVQAFQQSD